jgi:hypothetical protein
MTKWSERVSSGAGNGGGSSNTLCGSTHEASARQLPTNHDHEGGFGRSSNISVINRRIRPPSLLTRSFHSQQRTIER